MLTHKPVLLEECIQALNIRPDGIYLDGTLGRAGHSREIARRLTTGRLICVDRDQAALDAAQERLGEWLDKVTLVHSNFDQLDAILDDLHLAGVDGMLFDLGVSSPQLDDEGAGVLLSDRRPSGHADGPLGGTHRRRRGEHLVSGGAAAHSHPVRGGAVRPSIAAAIVRRRQERPIETTLDLVEVIKSGMPARALKEKQHPAKRSFQAIRIAVNDELSSVDRMIQAAVPRLNQGGRLAVITFHSLEDRIVKTGLAAFAKGCTCPPDFPVCVCGKTPDVKLISRKAHPAHGGGDRGKSPGPERQAAGGGEAQAPGRPELSGQTVGTLRRNGVNGMASRRRNRPSYDTYGNVAYAPAYDGSAVRAPGREETLQPKPKVRPRERERTLTRTRVQVREAGEVSPFAVIGFLAVGIFAALLMWSYAQYVVTTDQLVTMRSELSDLQEENVRLSAQYEKVFDMERIQAAVGDTMIRPTNDQIVYLDLSEPDNVVLYGEKETTQGPLGLLEGLKELFGDLFAYFQ